MHAHSRRGAVQTVCGGQCIAHTSRRGINYIMCIQRLERRVLTVVRVCLTSRCTIGVISMVSGLSAVDSMKRNTQGTRTGTLPCVQPPVLFPRGPGDVTDYSRIGYIFVPWGPIALNFQLVSRLAWPMQSKPKHKRRMLSKRGLW